MTTTEAGQAVAERGEDLPPVNLSAVEARPADIDSAGVGSVLRYLSGGDADHSTAYAKVAPDAWRRFRNGRHSRVYEERTSAQMVNVLSSNHRTYGWDVLVRSGPWSNFGQPVEAAQHIIDCPVSTRLRSTADGNPTILRKISDEPPRQWERESDGSRFSNGSVTASIPGGWLWDEPAAAQAPEPEWVMETGARITTVEQIASLPVGTIVRSGRRTNYFIKSEQDDRWDTCTEGGASAYFYGGPQEILAHGPVIYRLPVSDEVREMMARVERCIDNTARDSGYQWVRDAGFWKLGIRPIPEDGSQIPWGSIIGLPDGAVVTYSQIRESGIYGVWRIRNGKADAVANEGRVNLGPETQVTLLGSPVPPVPHYRGPNHFLHEVWVLMRKYKRMNGWCEAVDNALERADLSDPGDVPDTPATMPEPGATLTLTGRGDLARFKLLPDGTTFITDGTMQRLAVKVSGTVRYASDLRDIPARSPLTVLNIPNAAPREQESITF